MLENKRLIGFAAGATAFGLSILSGCAEGDTNTYPETIVPSNTPSLPIRENPENIEEAPTINQSTPYSTIIPLETAVHTPTPAPIFEPTATSSPPIETPSPVPSASPEAIAYEGPTFEAGISSEEWSSDSLISEIDFGIINGNHIHLQNIEQTDPFPDEELEAGESPYRVPQSAIATIDFLPKENLRYIYGHCINPGTGERLPIADIEYLEVGNQAIVFNKKREELLFDVDQIAISATLGEEAALYLKDYPESTIMIQTSVRKKDGIWLLDSGNKEELLAKARITEEQLEIGKYYVVFVILKQVENPFIEN